MAGVAHAGEIAAGSMLGLRYDDERFYVRASPRSAWQETYRDGPYRRQARGKLMMIRAPQALFDDEWLSEVKFSPDDNTQALIDALDHYKAHGVLGVAVSLQGADPGYSAERLGIERRSGATYGRGEGTLISAFKPDGSLKKAWMERLAKLLNATRERGMFVCLTYFHPAQDEALQDAEAVVAAARNATRWLIANDARNVIVDVAWGWDVEGEWDHLAFIPRNIANLVHDVREQFNDASFSLPIGAASGPGMAYPLSLARVCDVVLLNAQGLDAARKSLRLSQLSENGRPLLIVNDHAEESAQDRSSASVAFRGGAGWTYHPVELATRFPFVYAPDGGNGASGRLAEALHAIAELVLRRPPERGE
jgi:hypothetical protein